MKSIFLAAILVLSLGSTPTLAQQFEQCFMEDGAAFVNGLARLTGADVRAATGRIGSPILGAR
jgi:hypothetical protein